MSSKGKKGKTLKDYALWERVRKTVKPLHTGKVHLNPEELFGKGQVSPRSSQRPVLVPGKPAPKSTPNHQDRGDEARPSLRQLQELQQRGLSGGEFKPSPERQLSTHPLSLDENTKRKIKKGKATIEATIDLHGMTQVEAHGRLLRFIQTAHTLDNRVVLVITGKGMDGKGALKRAVPHWLAESPMRQMVSGYSQAHQIHGGEGALYVRIKRKRDKP